uniref:Uncharacterized protein n=1 Tax=Ditylenchus dipsaci TaxID=166011 RepID=A0A915E1N6_9BILA
MTTDVLKSQNLFVSSAKTVLANEKLLSSGMLRSRFVEQTPVDSVLEIIFGQTGNQKKFFPLFKVIILVKHGEIVLFQFYASSETLKYNQLGQLDPLEQLCSGSGIFDTQVMQSLASSTPGFVGFSDTLYVSTLAAAVVVMYSKNLFRLLNSRTMQLLV